MIWSLQQLQAAKHKPLQFDETIDLSAIKERDGEIRAIEPVRIVGQIDYVRDMITFTFRMTTTLTLPCSRTLVDVLLPIDLNVKEQFQQGEGWNQAEEGEDEEIHAIEGSQIDLEPYLMERILLEIPMQIFAEEVEEPKAPSEGKDWEVVSEEDVKNRIDPRLADLAKFFDKK
ncbi:YceD family protein [Alkalihalobacillus sp. 1P02AB]|uniref:YceD family protein n=1 Tax=Alkalihalobacillus sp. 1P02AB TaxID=3132260 RepID=UPI0039A4928E